MRIEDYALIGDTQSAALVSREGSIDWLCFPRFDSGACFAALLGTAENGRWSLRPSEELRSIQRRYRPDTLVLETEYTTASGRVRVIDCMPPREATPDVVRLVEGIEGNVPMRMELTLRFDYGSIIPWVRKIDGRLRAVAGPDAVTLTTDVETHGEGFATVSEFSVSPGHRVPFTLCWHPSHLASPPALDARQAVRDTEGFWQEWVSRCQYRGPWRDAVVRSLITLKALTYAPTGGIVAAPTTSLPEQLGGVRNWDYRYCWLRDASFTLNNLLLAGYRDEARAWRDWLLRAVAGEPAKLQIMYGVSGERRLTEFELQWLRGYEGASPVRVGNAASGQLQLDVFGELLDTLWQARNRRLTTGALDWRLALVILEFLEKNWQRPDEGIWEVRGPPRQFVYSKVMCWVAFDRAIQAAEHHHLHDAPLERWRKVRQEIFDEVMERGFDTKRQTFTQYYGSKTLDAALLRIPLVGFLAPDDPRVLGTVRATERELMHDGLVRRYNIESEHVDGLPRGEGVFLACSFWLVDNYALTGRLDDARKLFERLVGMANDVGLLAEEYDPSSRRLVGNFPQAFSHLALINSAFNLSGHRDG